MLTRRDLLIGGGAAAATYLTTSFTPLLAQNTPNAGKLCLPGT